MAARPRSCARRQTEDRPERWVEFAVVDERCGRERIRVRSL